MTTIERKRGDTWLIPLWVADDNGVAITDFTDYEIWLTIKSQSTDSDDDAIFQVTLSGGGITVDDAPTGKVMATITGTEIAEIKSYIADFQVTDADGITESSDNFTIKVTADITRTV